MMLVEGVCLLIVKDLNYAYMINNSLHKFLT